MEITILTNNNATPGFLAEHGLSIHINHPIYKILFDTGYTDVYLNNAKKLGLAISEIDYIVLSHGHYDHTGGLRSFPSKNQLKKVVIHKDAFFPKYAKDSFLRYNGIPFSQSDLPWLKKLVQEVNGFVQVAPFFYVLGDIPHQQENKKYFLGNKLDDFHDEIILVLEESNALTLFMGCSHFGVVNGVQQVKTHFPDKKIKSIVAGMHLKQASKETLERVADAFELIDFEQMIPLHCTGDKAIHYFKERFKKRCILMKAGQSKVI